jgi:NDP-sugar pyrophosphorylase family protein
MKAMILAAGLGTRLRPLTNNRPKALVEISGRTLLEITLNCLRSFGIREVIINVHHHADMVTDYLEKKSNLGMRVEISREEILLDTGGGLKRAGWFFQETPEDFERPFILHNVDVLSTIDLQQMAAFHCNHNALATLAVQDRETSRYLLFDEQDQLCGRRAGESGLPEMVRATSTTRPLAFSGIHVISPKFLSLISEDGAFSIIDAYLRLAGNGQSIAAFRSDDSYWRDLGKPENLTEAAHDLQEGIVRLS